MNYCSHNAISKCIFTTFPYEILSNIFSIKHSKETYLQKKNLYIYHAHLLVIYNKIIVRENK